jgi:protoporphyrinogen IX oxidase
MDYYFWIKAGHLIAVITFLGGMVLNGFLFRNLRPGTPDADRLVSSARKWNGFVIAPAMVLVWLFGLSLAFQGHWYMDLWLMIKAVLVLLLSGLHGAQMGALRRMKSQPTTAVSASLYHSAPIALVLMAIIVVLVSVKPFT